MAPLCKRCNKRRYGKGGAFHAALNSSRAFGAAMAVYQCPHGNGWHLTRGNNGTG